MSKVSFEDFLEKLSEVRFTLEVDRHLQSAGGQGKLGHPPSEASGSKSPKRDSRQGGTGSGRYSNDRTETVSVRVQTEKGIEEFRENYRL